MVIFANLGGVFNLVVYVIIRRRQLRFIKGKTDKKSQEEGITNNQTASISGKTTGEMMSSDIITSTESSRDVSNSEQSAV